MKRIFIFLFFGLSTCLPSAQAQDIPVQWNILRKGLEMANVPYPFEILCGDSMVSLFRISKGAAKLRLACAATKWKAGMKAEEWAEKEGFDLVFNAGMYIPGSFKAKAYMKSGAHLNQAASEPNFGGLFLLDGIGSQAFCLLNKSEEGNGKIRGDYLSAFECMRLLDGRGNPLSWHKKKQRCSMLAAAQDLEGNLVLAFCRSPMYQSQMAEFLASLSLKLKSAFYLEGGPETSIFIRLESGNIRLMGSYVSQTWERCDNLDFRKLPNVVGLNFLE